MSQLLSQILEESNESLEEVAGGDLTATHFDDEAVLNEIESDSAEDAVLGTDVATAAVAAATESLIYLEDALESVESSGQQLGAAGAMMARSSLNSIRQGLAGVGLDRIGDSILGTSGTGIESRAGDGSLSEALELLEGVRAGISNAWRKFVEMLKRAWNAVMDWFKTIGSSWNSLIRAGQIITRRATVADDLPAGNRAYTPSAGLVKRLGSVAGAGDLTENLVTALEQLGKGAAAVKASLGAGSAYVISVLGKVRNGQFISGGEKMYENYVEAVASHVSGVKFPTMDGTTVNAGETGTSTAAAPHLVKVSGGVTQSGTAYRIGERAELKKLGATIVETVNALKTASDNLVKDIDKAIKDAAKSDLDTISQKGGDNESDRKKYYKKTKSDLMKMFGSLRSFGPAYISWARKCVKLATAVGGTMVRKYPASGR